MSWGGGVRQDPWRGHIPAAELRKYNKADRDEQPYEVQYLDADGVSHVFGLTADENGGWVLAYARLAGFEAEVFPREKLSAFSPRAMAAGGGR